MGRRLGVVSVPGVLPPVGVDQLPPTTSQRRWAREVIRAHDELLAIRLDRYDPIPQPHPDPYLGNMLDVLEEQRTITVRSGDGRVVRTFRSCP